MKSFLTLLLLLPVIAMGQVSDATGLSQANTIKNETVPNANTPTRVGTNFVNLWNSKGNKQEANTWSATQTFSAAVGIIANEKIGIGASPTYNLDIQFNSGSSVVGRILNSGAGASAFITQRTGASPVTWSFGVPAGTTTFTITEEGVASHYFFAAGGDFTATKSVTTGAGTASSSGSAFTSKHDASAASGNVIGSAINLTQSVASTGVHFGNYVKVRGTHTSGTVNQLLAGQYNAENVDAGTVTNLRGVLGSTLTTNGPVTNAIGVKAEGVFIAGNAAVTNSYGLHVVGATIGSGTVTNNFGVYVDDAAATNVFQGPSIFNGGVKVEEGSNEFMGVATLVGGTVTVNNTSVAANSRIFLTSQADGGTPGFLRVSARSAATSFTITSSSGTDTSTVAWIIINPN